MQQMLLVIQVPAKHSYSVIRGKSVRLRVPWRKSDNLSLLNSFIDLYDTYEDVVSISSTNINILLQATYRLYYTRASSYGLI